MNKVILVSKKEIFNEKEFSLEFGKHDGVNHFDHHGDFSGNPAPCNNAGIKSIPDDGVIYVNHLDVDNYLGILRMQGIRLLKELDLDQVELVDVNGTYSLNEEQRNNTTSQYYVGFGGLVRKFQVPRVSETEVDITEIVRLIIATSFDNICAEGRTNIRKMQEDFRDCVVETLGECVFLKSVDGKALNVSLAYDKGFKVAVVYRDNYNTISVYARPDTDYSFAGKEISGILFEGHEKACGSPRGTICTFDQAKEVFDNLSKWELMKETIKDLLSTPLAK